MKKNLKKGSSFKLKKAYKLRLEKDRYDEKVFISSLKPEEKTFDYKLFKRYPMSNTNWDGLVFNKKPSLKKRFLLYLLSKCS